MTILIDADTVTVIHHDSGEVLSEHTIDPDPATGTTNQTTWPMAKANMNDDATQI